MVIINKETNTDKFVVVQSNDLIEALYSPALTARAHKVARLIFSLISPEDKDLKLYSITIDAMKRYLGYKNDVTWGRFQDDLRDIADRLNKEPIVIKTTENILTAYLIAAYAVDYKKGVVTFEIPLLLKPFLLELKRNFTMYPLLYIPKLKSSYSIRLYELLYQYKSIGHRTFELEDLQKKVGSEYDLYGDFKRKVLGIAQRDLEEHTDIRFEYKEIKNVRKVSALKFSIIANQPKQDTPKQTILNFLEEAVQVDEKPEVTNDILQILVGWGMNEKSLSKYTNLGFNVITDDAAREKAEIRCGTLEKYYQEKINLVENASNARNTEGGANRVGFFIKALQEDWQNLKAIKEQQDKDVKKKQMNVQKRLKELNIKKEALKKQLELEKANIYELIVADALIFDLVYEETKKGVTSFRETVFPSNMPAIECFKKGGMSRNLLAAKMEELFPEKFMPYNDLFKNDILSIQKESEDLQKMMITA
jgi:plasmid replication initiation protein